MCCAIRYLDPASVRWVDDQQQEGGGSGGGDTLIMLCNHMDTILMLSTPPIITTTSSQRSKDELDSSHLSLDSVSNALAQAARAGFRPVREIARYGTYS